MEHDKKLALAHRFSWEITFGPIPDGLHVMHKCDVGRCVNPAHLTLGTHQENIKDRDNKGRQRSPKGQDSPHAKLLNADVIEIRKRFAAGETQSHLAREFGVTPAAIYYIVNRKTYKHI